MKKLLAFIAAALLALAAGDAQAQVNAPVPVKLAALTNTAVAVGPAGNRILQEEACSNANASTVFLQAYDTAGAVVVGTTPSYFFIPIPAGASNFKFTMQFHNAIQVAATTTAGGGTAPGTALDCSVGIN